jgi:anti-sigma factor RsiW
MKNFTPEELLEYYYGEMDAKKSAEIQKFIEENWALKEKMRVIAEAAERLDKSMVSPRKKSVEDILKYAARRSKATI